MSDVRCLAVFLSTCPAFYRFASKTTARSLHRSPRALSGGSAELQARRKKLAPSLAVVVAALDDPDSLLPAISALGKRHTHYGVEHHHFDSVGEALLTAIGTTLGTSYTQEIHDAWADAYALVAAVMKRALIRAEEANAGGVETVSQVTAASEKAGRADMQ